MRTRTACILCFTREGRGHASRTLRAIGIDPSGCYWSRARMLHNGADPSASCPRYIVEMTDEQEARARMLHDGAPDDVWGTFEFYRP